MYVNHHTAIYQDKVHMFDVFVHEIRNAYLLVIHYEKRRQTKNTMTFFLALFSFKQYGISECAHVNFAGFKFHLKIVDRTF